MNYSAICKKYNLTDMRYASLSDADLSDADMRYASLSCADLGYASLSGADLSGADMRYANLHYADLSGADLSNANLGYANLSNANLLNANLHNADLRHANLGYANLHNANLHNANLLNAIGDGVRIFSLSTQPWCVVIVPEFNHMTIGCQTHLIHEWMSFGDDEIAKMEPRALDFWKKYKPTIYALCDSIA